MEYEEITLERVSPPANCNLEFIWEGDQDQRKVEAPDSVASALVPQ